jgi:hypothetical protein
MRRAGSLNTIEHPMQGWTFVISWYFLATPIFFTIPIKTLFFFFFYHALSTLTFHFFQTSLRLIYFYFT